MGSFLNPISNTNITALKLHGKTLNIASDEVTSMVYFLNPSHQQYQHFSLSKCKVKGKVVPALN
jgi:hypothetical protein